MINRLSDGTVCFLPLYLALWANDDPVANACEAKGLWLESSRVYAGRAWYAHILPLPPSHYKGRSDREETAFPGLCMDNGRIDRGYAFRAWSLIQFRYLREVSQKCGVPTGNVRQLSRDEVFEILWSCK